MMVQPKPGTTGDRSLLAALEMAGIGVEPVANMAKVKIKVDGVAAASPEQARESALARVRNLIPPAGYDVSEAESEKIKT